MSPTLIFVQSDPIIVEMLSFYTTLQRTHRQSVIVFVFLTLITLRKTDKANVKGWLRDGTQTA